MVERTDGSEKAAVVSPFTRVGSCSVCGGRADELWGHRDWWHNEATDCNGRHEGFFVPAVLRESIARGVRQVEDGHLIDFGSFAEHADDDPPPAASPSPLPVDGNEG